MRLVPKQNIPCNLDSQAENMVKISRQDHDEQRLLNLEMDREGGQNRLDPQDRVKTTCFPCPHHAYHEQSRCTKLIKRGRGQSIVLV